MSSSSSSSSSSAALATVTVTARDIEFSDYNSATGKWESAVMTMMIEDTNTPDNINLEVYSEKVYAVFRNHDDPTDLVEFSPEVDGMDFRVTTSEPMVPSAKYELYKVYGETSGGEYATSSQFYFQVPGKVWDFANDVVDHDVELVSDWFNYGYIKDTNDVIHGVTTKDELRDAVSASSDSTVFTVDGTPLTRQDVKGVKITSMLDSDLRLTTHADPSFLNKYDNVEEVDIVSAKVTKLMRGVNDNFTYEGKVTNYNGCSGFSIPKVNQKIAFPETLRFLTFMASSPITGTSVFNKPIYMPDSVTVSYYLFDGHNNKSIFNSKVRFSPNLNHVPGNNLYSFSNWNYPIEPIGQNYQLTGTSMSFLGFSGYNQPFTIPSVWTYIPEGFLNYTNKFDQDIIIPSNIVGIQSSAFRSLNLGGDGVTKKVILPSTITTIGNSAFYSLGRTTAGAEVDMSNCVNITSYGADFGWSTIKDFKWPSRFASNNISIMNRAFSYSTFKIDPDPNTNFVEFALPEGISEIGNSAFRSIYRSANMKVVMPSTLTKIGYSCFYSWDTNNTKKMHFDFTKLNPDDVVIDDRLEYNGLRNDVPGFAVITSDYSSSWYDLTIEIAPGTQEAWEAKLPDFKLVSPSWAQNTTFSRKINWVEQPTQYGYVFYRNEGNPSEEKYVELTSAAEFASLCFTNTPESTQPLGVDGIVLYNNAPSGVPVSQKNFITGFICGTDITSIPDKFLRNCYKLDREVKFGENVTTIGNDVLDGAFDMDMSSYTPLGHTASVKFLGTSLTTIGQNFLHTARHFNADLTLPDGLTSIGYQFMLQVEHFNSNLTFPNSVTSFDARWFMCVPDKMTGTIDFGDMTTSEMMSPMDALSTRDSTADCYTVGITIKGTNSTAIINKINNASSLGYRNLIDGGV